MTSDLADMDSTGRSCKPAIDESSSCNSHHRPSDLMFYSEFELWLWKGPTIEGDRQALPVEDKDTVEPAQHLRQSSGRNKLGRYLGIYT